jgi:hypothetical protein
MFDDSLYLRSKVYFRMEQLCRIFSCSVEETIKDIKKTQSENMRSFKNQYRWDKNFASDIEVLETEWNKSTADQTARLNVVLDLIRRKKEEVVSLRDGVSCCFKQAACPSPNLYIAF